MQKYYEQSVLTATIKMKILFIEFIEGKNQTNKIVH